MIVILEKYVGKNKRREGEKQKAAALFEDLYDSRENCCRLSVCLVAYL
jgi:hypothetical protein